MRVSAVLPLDGPGLTVAIALPPFGVRSVLRTLGSSGGPGVARKGTCRVESSGEYRAPRCNLARRWCLALVGMQ